MLQIFLTRHGETKWNLENRLQGWQDSDLTQKGIQNAHSLNKRLQNIEFNAIYSSPSKRAMHTSSIINSQHEIPIIEDARLKEMYLGQWEGKTKEEIVVDFANEFDAFWNAPHIYNHLPHQAESFEELKNRVGAALQDIVNANESGNVLVVAHGVVIKVLLSIINQTPLAELWDSMFIQGASLTIIEVNNGEFDVRLLGDTSHFQ